MEKKTRDSLSNAEKTWAVSVALFRGRVNMVKLRSVSAFTLTLKPSHEYFWTRQSEKMRNNVVSLKVCNFVLSRLNFLRANLIHGNEWQVDVENANTQRKKEISSHFKQLSLFRSCALKTVMVFLGVVHEVIHVTDNNNFYKVALFCKTTGGCNAKVTKWQRCHCKIFLMALFLSYKIRSQTFNTSFYILLTT